MISVRPLCSGEHELRVAQSKLQVADENAMIEEGFGPPSGDAPFEFLNENPLSPEEKAEELKSARAAYYADLSAARSARARTEARLRLIFGWLLFFPIEIVLALLSIIVAPVAKRIRPSPIEDLFRFNIAEINPDAGRAGARIARFRASA
ncbi:MAG: hypothetical protein HUU29_12815 [Planctomycetaceae bacterium]|nr:hypothetical protein [Planctomycetaceae bacterium]